MGGAAAAVPMVRACCGAGAIFPAMSANTTFRSGTMALRLAILICLFLAGAVEVRAQAQPLQALLAPPTIQALIVRQLFSRNHRWYLVDDSECYAYLEGPKTFLRAGRLFLDAHLSARWGPTIGDQCYGVAFASNVTLSTAIKAAGPEMLFDDIRIESIHDPATANAIELLKSADPDAIPKSFTTDFTTLMRDQSPAGSAGQQRLRITKLTTRADGIAVEYVPSSR
jgi:hypothetical protein